MVQGCLGFYRAFRRRGGWKLGVSYELNVVSMGICALCNRLLQVLYTCSCRVSTQKASTLSGFMTFLCKGCVCVNVRVL